MQLTKTLTYCIPTMSPVMCHLQVEANVSQYKTFDLTRLLHKDHISPQFPLSDDLTAYSLSKLLTLK